MRIAQLRLLLSGLTAGDCIGSLTEFVPQSDVLREYAIHEKEGWPFVSVRGPVWDRGEPTDDTEMAMCIVRACVDAQRFDPEAVAAQFVSWLDSDPKDIGGTTVRSLSRLRAGAPWHEAGHSEYRARPGNAANGSLMRNGVIPAMADSLAEAFTHTAHHAMMTHYDPLSMLCCGIHTWLIWRLLEGRRPLDGEWLTAFRREWTDWLAETGDVHVRKWRGHVEATMKDAWETVTAAPFKPEAFNPFEVDCVGRTGYCLLTLQISLWALQWSKMTDEFPVPDGFPASVFEKRGAWCVGWPAMLGYDADTYGAVAGPLIAAAHGQLPESMTRGLKALREFDDLAAGRH